jgi:hypothetical protein
MDQWIQRQRDAARVSEGDEPDMDAIKAWQEEARTVADEAGRHGTKKAVQECPPSDEAARALFEAFAIEAEVVFHVCREAYQAYTDSGHEDEPHLSLEDLLQEAYVLFQRSMVRFQGERTLERHVRRPFRDRVRAYLDAQLSTYDDPENRPAVEDQAAFAPGYDMAGIYDELREEDRLPKRADRLWREAYPQAE